MHYSKICCIFFLIAFYFKVITWRQMWIWLAEAEHELGLKQVTIEAIDEMKRSREIIDWPMIRAEEKRLKHDVMAHNYTFGEICPKARGIIHLGATSCFVQDNSDLIIQRQCIDVILNKLAICLDRLGDFADRTKEVVTVGRTHLQSASLVTVGKRAIIWAQELLMVLLKLERFYEEMRFRGIKGATGTQDSFLTLFHGEEDKVEKLDDLVTKKAGFTHRFSICGQTYSRQQDCDLINILALLGASLKKICMDLRFLQAVDELVEPFESEQIGSSAMPYKKNPMKSERICSLARRLISAPQDSLNTFGDQVLERTLDDSAIRRILIPESFLNVTEGLSLRKENINRNVMNELPFLMLEKALMWLTEIGIDRQHAHEKIREVALAAKEASKLAPISINSILSDVFFDPVRNRVIDAINQPLSFTGRCVSQTVRFLNDELRPAITKYLTAEATKKVDLDI
ncbi:unnamed protein product [Dracunculus medinensis]|uniref:Adenylosuccinate lyase C-terminal domain-containing protein n=1 Tax=Dracunculus medinensis TaxID=318479 RepID=A0A3P7PQB0_DRAME|nr:unnamed protein product [Dracunculus medinensis]